MIEIDNKPEELNFFAKWAQFFLKKYKITLIFLIAVVAIGLFSAGQNQRQDFPAITVNFAFISAVYPGAGPEAVANELINPIENAVKGHSEVERIRSTASPNFGFTFIELKSFDKETIEKTIADLSDMVDQLALPEGVETRVFAEDAIGLTIAYALSSEDKSFDEVLAAAPKIKEYLENSSPDIKEVQIGPDSAFDVRIELDAAKLALSSLDTQTVKNIIQASLSVFPGGSIKDTETDLKKQINIKNPATGIEDIKNIVLPGGVKLSDVAKITRQPSNIEALTMAGYLKDGKAEYNSDAVYLLVSKTADADVIRMKKSVDEALEKVYEKGALPPAIEINLVMDTAISVEKQIDSLLRNGLIGLIAIIVVFMFFIDLRIGLVVGLIIPFAFLITLIVLYAIGYTLNTLTLFAMILTLGILVDNAIVIAEGILHRIHRYGEKKLKASILAIRDLGPAVTAATLTTVVVFFPAANMGGFMGEIMKFIPYTIIIMMIVSYFLAISITPLLAKWILKEETEEERAAKKIKSWQKNLILPAMVFYGQRFIDRVVRGYEIFMRKVHQKLSLKITIVALVAVAFVGSMSIASSGKIPSSQFPITDTWQFQISSDFPVGTSYEVKKEIMSDLVKEGVSVPYFEGSYIWNNINYVLIEYPADRSDDKDTTVYTIVEALDDKIQYIRDKAPEGTYISIDVSSYGPPVSAYDVILEIKNTDDTVLEKAVADIDGFVKEKSEAGAYKISRILNELKDNLVPSIDISFDKEKIRQLGIAPLSTSLIVNSVFSESDVSKITLREDGIADDVVLTFNKESANSIDKLNKLLIPTATGQVVSLDEIADIQSVESAESIKFIDGEKTVLYQIDLDIPKDDRSGVAKNLETDLKEYLNEEKLASLGLEKDAIAYGGFASELQADMDQLMMVFFIAIIAVFLILVFQFNSYVQPALILLAIPMALIGVFPGLWLVGSSIDMISGLGIIALVGIVVNDAIVFVDYYNRQRKKHSEWSMLDALVYTGKVRFKPIFGTSITTIAGVLPLTISDPFWQGLGTAIIAGLIFSTIGNLIILPILIYVTEQLKTMPGRLLKKRREAREAA